MFFPDYSDADVFFIDVTIDAPSDFNGDEPTDEQEPPVDPIDFGEADIAEGGGSTFTLTDDDDAVLAGLVGAFDAETRAGDNGTLEPEPKPDPIEEFRKTHHRALHRDVMSPIYLMRSGAL